jgi:hypothetical protein
MGDVRFELNLKGLNELMKSSEIQAVLDKAGEQVANAAGSDYAASGKTGKYIGFSNIYPDSKRAAHENYTQNTLLKALQSSGLRMSK